VIGRVAYRLVRDVKIGGFIELEGERKQIWEFSWGSLSVELFAAASLPPRSPTSRSSASAAAPGECSRSAGTTTVASRSCTTTQAIVSGR
jgi:hypothetical protein